MSVKSIKTSRAIFALLGILGLAVAVIIANKPPDNGPLKDKFATLYRSATCGCCANYAKYLRRLGAKVEEKIVVNMDDVKKEFGVPTRLGSCHTTRIENFTVEGHIPIEGIQKLLAEKPAVNGIALPGMPSGSPGMPGKKEPFYIEAFSASGSSTSYVTL